MCIANEFLEFIKITLTKDNHEYFIPSYPNRYLKWTYESFDKFLYWNFIRDKEGISNELHLKRCLHPEVQTGNEISISGIYDPWFDQPVYKKLTDDPGYNPYVGCPKF